MSGQTQFPFEHNVARDVDIVAVLGSTGSGKSAVAQHLVVKHGYTRLRFAQPLKDMLRAMGLTEQQVDGPQAVRLLPDEMLCGKSPRYAMQTLGTEWRNYLGKDLWSRIMRRRIEELVQTGKRRFVIDDARFLHEAAMIRDLGGRVVALRRPDVEPGRLALAVSRIPMPQIARAVLHMAFGIQPLHVSETEWFKIETTDAILNTGTLSDLWSDVDMLVATRNAR